MNLIVCNIYIIKYFFHISNLNITMEINMSDDTAQPSALKESKLKLGALTALVVGSMIGGGIFSLPQNMASGAGAGAPHRVGNYCYRYAHVGICFPKLSKS